MPAPICSHGCSGPSELQERIEMAQPRNMPITEEKAHTELYFALLHARFGDRLRLTWDLDPALGAVPVPRFAFQLLLENAVKHNQDRSGPLEIRLRARRERIAAGTGGGQEPGQQPL